MMSYVWHQIQIVLLLAHSYQWRQLLITRCKIFSRPIQHIMGTQCRCPKAVAPVLLGGAEPDGNANRASSKFQTLSRNATHDIFDLRSKNPSLCYSSRTAGGRLGGSEPKVTIIYFICLWADTKSIVWTHTLCRTQVDKIRQYRT